MTLALICAGLLAGAPAGAPAPAVDLAQAYREARDRAGKSSGEQVRLALWCEAHGLTRERLDHLALAVLTDPRNATARGLMGLVPFDGRFLRPEAVADRVRADPALAEYEARRIKAPYTADGQWSLGLWAEGRGLKEQARAHFTAATRLDPTRENAWKRLGYRRRDGRWVSDAQLAAEKLDAEAQKQADRHWLPVLERYRSMLLQPARRGEVEAALGVIAEPRSVPSIVKVFGATEATQPAAARLLGQVDSAAASRALATLAVSARSAEARQVAAETLRRRDPREYAEALIGLIREPIAYRVRPVGGPGSPGVLSIEGKQATIHRNYAPPAGPSEAPAPGDRVVLDEQGLPAILRDAGTVTYGMDVAPLSLAAGATGRGASTGGPGGLASLPIAVGFSSQATTQVRIPIGQMRAEALKSAQAAQGQLEADVAALEEHNASVRRRNRAAVAILAPLAGRDLGDDPRAWRAWWVDQLGFRMAVTQESPKPTLFEEVPLAYEPAPVGVDVSMTARASGPSLVPVGFQGPPMLVVPPGSPTFIDLSARLHSCFAAGTPVRTIAGPRPIESLKVGDLVLTQDVATGALGYHPILVVHRNPPIITYRVRLRGEAILATPFHRFWVAGRGWAMARDLRAGDPIRTLGGVTPVEALEPDRVRPVFNLDVAEHADFFAGDIGALVHDNTLPDPRLVPFDAQPAALAARPAN